MIAYWFYFCVPLAALLSPVRLTGVARGVAWALFILGSILFIGLRSEVGGDWDNYLDFFYRASDEDFSFVYQSREPGYVLLNWVSGKLGWGIYGVNTVCAVLFVGGLAIFCLRQPIPILAWLIATPYLFVVVGMGYTRQSVATGLAIGALALLQERRALWFFSLILAATLFHKSAILLAIFGLVLLDENGRASLNDKLQQYPKVKGSLLAALPIVCSFVVALVVANPDRVFSEFREYVLKDSWHSEGGMVRALMNAGPAIFLLMFHRHWKKLFGESNLWFSVAWFVVLLLLLTPLFSTLSDRLAIYLIPIQIYVLSRVPLFFKQGAFQGVVAVSISGLYALVLFVWLNYADHAYYWVPYKGVGIF